MNNEEEFNSDDIASLKNRKKYEELQRMRRMREIELSLLKEKEIRARFYSKTASSLMAAVAVVLSVIVGITSVIKLKDSPLDISALLTETKEQASSETYTKVSDEISSLKKSIAVLESAKSEVAVGSDIASFRVELDALSRRIALIESAVGNSPEKMLSVPILRKDFDNHQNYTSTQLAEIKSAIASSNETFKWLIGLVVTVGLGVFGVLFSSWSDRKKA